ncbi:MAG TPA: carbohydrate porin [Candidatus Angelobacter sp.]|nr:carbohydrate porin [Candidatus Angelobacter sp.]
MRNPLLLSLKAAGALLLCGALLVPACAQQAPPEEPPEQPPTMFPHPEDAPWWVSGQINVIFQGHPGFHALYSGPNSLRAQGETATSHVVTLYTAYAFNRSTEVLFDLESASGRGLSDALGLAGITNLDAVRNPTLGIAPYIARAEVHKVFALSSEEEDQERIPTNSILTRMPVRRLEVRAGKMSLVDFFDVNPGGSDSHLQFLNWTADNNASYDYAADTRGYTYAAIVEYEDRNWGLRFAEGLMPKVANGPDLDFNISRARSENVELELRPQLVKERKTVLLFLSYVNHANMGSYGQAVQAFLNGTTAQPDIVATRRQGRIKYGFGFNFEHELAKNVRAFGRVGWNEGQNESFAYTEANQSVQIGGDWRAESWHRPWDKFGMTFMSNAISRAHQSYLALGGQGFLLGDGRLTYARENILESYYNAHLWRGLYLSPNLQFIVNPGYNQDRGPVLVGGLRLHLEL